MRKLKITELNRLTVDEFKKADKLPLAVVLDEVRSLHNIGSVFRTSDAFLVDCIYLCGITATPPHPEMHKTALGAENSVEWRYKKNTLDAVQELDAVDQHLVGVGRGYHGVVARVGALDKAANQTERLEFEGHVLGVEGYLYGFFLLEQQSLEQVGRLLGQDERRREVNAVLGRILDQFVCIRSYERER